MKTLLLIMVALLLTLLPSCVVDPFVKDYPDGHSVASSGGVFAARRRNAVVYIKTRNGNIIKFGSEEESGEDVPVAGIQGLVTHGASQILGHSNDVKTLTDGKVETGKQGVTKFIEGEKTKRILGTFVPPEPKVP